MNKVMTALNRLQELRLNGSSSREIFLAMCDLSKQVAESQMENGELFLKLVEEIRNNLEELNKRIKQL